MGETLYWPVFSAAALDVTYMSARTVDQLEASRKKEKRSRTSH